MGRVNFGSGRCQANQFLVQYICYAKTSDFVENFEFSMIQFGSILGLLLGEYSLDVGLGCGFESFDSGFRSQVSLARSKYYSFARITIILSP